jgi:hypothetical protein
MPSARDYVNRLQEEARRSLAEHIRNLESELAGIQGHISESLAGIGRNFGALHESLLPGLEPVFGKMIEEVNQKSASARTQEMGFLAHFVHGMRQRETQEEILQLLLDTASRYAPKLALFVTRNQRLIGWSSRGLPESIRSTVEACAIPCDESAFLAGALGADGLTTAPNLDAGDALIELFGTGKTGPWHAFPLKAIGRPVAVLLAAPESDRGCDLEALCVLMDATGLCVENMALKVLQEMSMARTTSAAPLGETAPEQPSSKPPADRSGQEAEDSLAADSEPVLATAEPETAALEEASEPEPASEITEAARIEIEIPLPMPAADAGIEELPPAAEPELPIELPGKIPEPAPIEEPVAEPAQFEPVETAEVAPTSIPVPRPEVKEAPKSSALREVQPLSEEEKLHADAKRFARLLASEIKLYNEQRVLEGRENRDIYVRLKRDIDRSREMYEKRVSPLVARKVDYFHDEIIRVLGDNDPSTLGSDYPGPRVES